MDQNNPKKIIIVGGGFGGIRTALDLVDKKIPNVKITLISDKPHFEYHPALYRVVTGKSPLEVCIPLREIFQGKEVEVVRDTIEDVNISNKVFRGTSGSRYNFDYAVLALGSETEYYGIPGLKEFSYGFKSIAEALRLKNHLHKLFETCTLSSEDQVEDLCRMHFVIVGAGASGVELAGELASYAKNLALSHGPDPRLITIDLIEAAPRILPMFPEKVSDKIASHLRNLGINIFTNQPMVKENLEEVSLKGMTLKTSTVIWTAGVKPNSLYGTIKEFGFDKRGRVAIDEYLRPEGLGNIFVIGDGASTPHSGMAQTASDNGKLAARNIANVLVSRPLVKYVPQKPFFSVPTGPGWAATLIGPLTFFGKTGWILRRLADLKYFLSILPFRKAILAFRSGKTLCEECEICLPQPTELHVK